MDRRCLSLCPSNTNENKSKFVESKQVFGAAVKLPLGASAP